MSAEKYLNRIENRGIGDPFTYSRKEMTDFAEKYHKKQLGLHGVSIAKRTFNSEKELLQFIYLHVPFAVKPTSKTAKTKLVPTFTSRNAFKQVCKELAKKLFNEC
jgi:hypothetical protein